VAKKKQLSGWQRRQLLKQDVKPNRRGRPCSPVKLQIYHDLRHELYLFLNSYSRRKKLFDFPRPLLVRALREHRPEFYQHLNDATLGRYAGEALRAIFAPRSRMGANFMQTILRR
jgi:hypothetical protein